MKVIDKKMVESVSRKMDVYPEADVEMVRIDNIKDGDALLRISDNRYYVLEEKFISNIDDTSRQVLCSFYGFLIWEKYLHNHFSNVNKIFRAKRATVIDEEIGDE